MKSKHRSRGIQWYIFIIMLSNILLNCRYSFSQEPNALSSQNKKDIPYNYELKASVFFYKASLYEQFVINKNYKPERKWSKSLGLSYMYNRYDYFAFSSPSTSTENIINEFSIYGRFNLNYLNALKKHINFFLMFEGYVFFDSENLNWNFEYYHINVYGAQVSIANEIAFKITEAFFVNTRIWLGVSAGSAVKPIESTPANSDLELISYRLNIKFSTLPTFGFKVLLN